MDSVLGKLKDTVRAIEQTSIFGESEAITAIKNVCVEYLKFYGYTVAEPKNFAVEIKTIDDFIIYFYRKLNVAVPEGYYTSYNMAKDRSTAKRFVESRMATTGASRAYVLSECGEIVRTLFDNRKEFINPKYHFDFSIFGNNRMKWVTNKAIHMMNKELEKEEEKKAEKMRQQALETFEGPSRFGKLDDILKQMEEDEDV